MSGKRGRTLTYLDDGPSVVESKSDKLFLEAQISLVPSSVIHSGRLDLDANAEKTK